MRSWINFLRRPAVFGVVVLVLLNVALFWKLYFQGLLPFPGNLLVSYYFPWNSGGFEGYDSWTTRKDVIAMDVIRQIYPWKALALDQIKSGQLPLWNPYNFSGTPLLANLQSSILFPGSLLFLVLPNIAAWTANVVLLPLLFSLFVFIFLRSLKLSYLPSTFGAIAASSISYLQVWAEQLVVIQSVLPLPLALWVVNKYSDSKKKIFLIAIPVLLAISLFGGHIQTTVYVWLLAAIYMLFQRVPIKYVLGVSIFSLAISCIQLLPSAELYLLSAREGRATQELFFSSTLPWENLITIVTPDFFGNPATGNFRGRDYGNFQAYFGITALVLAILAIKFSKENRNIRFFLFTAVIGLFFSLAPLAYTFMVLKLPVLSSGYPSRFIFFFQFSMTILAAFGLEQILSSQGRKIPKIIILLGTFLIGLFIIASLQTDLQSVITRNNLVLPLAIFFTSLVLVRFKRLTFLVVVLAIVEYSYFFNKYQPFSLQKFVFPDHPVFRFLQEEGGQSRFFGVDRAYIDSNFATYYRVYSPEGYDPLYLRRYGEFTASAKSGALEIEIPRSDAVIKTDIGHINDRAFDILGVKYIVDKTDDPAKEWEPNLARFPVDRYQMVWRVNKWKIFERKTVLPRAFLVGSFEILPNADQAIRRLYDPSFDHRNTVLLEKKPAIEPLTGGDSQTTIETYSPNRVIIKTSATSAKLMFLSDNFYPGWKVSVDGQEAEILRANYSFRAVPLDGGSHRIVFRYDPLSFKMGAVISLLSLVLLWGSGIYLARKKK